MTVKNKCTAQITSLLYCNFHSDFLCAPSSSPLESSSLSSSSSSSSSSSFFLPNILLQGMLETTTSMKNPPTPTVAIVVKMSRGWEGPAFSLALVTEIHSLNLGSKKEFWLHSSWLQ